MIVIEPSHISVDAINGNDDTGLTASSSKPFKSLRRACAVARSSDTIIVYPGTYKESPGEPKDIGSIWTAPHVLNGLNDVTIRGIGQPVFQMQTPGNGISIVSCARATIEGITLQGQGPLTETNAYYFAAVLLSGVNDRVTVKNCRIENWGNHGIAHLHGARTSDNCVFEGNVFDNGGNYGHSFLGADGAAIAVGGSGTTVRNNRINNWLRGVETEASDPSHPTNDVVIEGNRLSNCPGWSILTIVTHGKAELFLRHRIIRNIITGLPPGAVTPLGTRGAQCGIGFGGGVGAIISENIVAGIGNGSGINVCGDWADVREVLIANNYMTGIDRHSLCVTDNLAGKATDCSILNNRITRGNGRGIYLQASGCFVQGNHVSKCQYVGIHQVGGANNLIGQNYCVDNKLRIDDVVPSLVTTDPWITAVAA